MCIFATKARCTVEECSTCYMTYHKVIHLYLYNFIRGNAVSPTTQLSTAVHSYDLYDSIFQLVQALVFFLSRFTGQLLRNVTDIFHGPGQLQRKNAAFGTPR